MRLFYLVKKELIEIIRQKELLPLLFIAPILQIIVLGYVVKRLMILLLNLIPLILTALQ